MIELPMTGFAGRSELKEEISGLLAKDIVDESLVINVYGDEGTGKSTLIAAVLGDFHKKCICCGYRSQQKPPEIS